MAAQGLSRKRPAPGNSPPPYQTQMQAAANVYGSGPGPQMSDEQFLQWSQDAQIPTGFQDTSPYNLAANIHNGAVSQTSNQLTRRLANQLANRPRSFGDGSELQWMDPGSASAQQPHGDDIEELRRKAQGAKKESQTKKKQIPPFIQKLNSFLDDGKNQDLIRWCADGKSFVVLDEDDFAKTLIPELFKHNNYASFVRQLNMYGFHKKVALSDNSMRASERKNKTPSEYYNEFFRRGEPELLWLIQKPKNANGPSGKGKKGKGEGDQLDDDYDEYVEEVPSAQNGVKFKPRLAIGQGEATLSQEQLADVQRELATIRQQQQQISRMMANLKHEHQQLYGQAANFQDQHTRHENSINAILTFLATVYNRSLQGQDGGAAGITNLFSGSIPGDNQGSVVDIGDQYLDQLNGVEANIPKPFKRPPLLLQAPPSEGQPGRTSNSSPSFNNSPFPGRQTRRMSQVLHSGTTPQSGNVEELFDSSASTPAQAAQTPGSTSARYPSQSDIMSVIHNTNARHSQPGTPANDFSNVLNSLENSGGNAPLTSSQRADMLRLMNGSTNQTGGNALISPNPPAMPNDYERQLARSQADLDSLAKMQADQNRSVENLSNLLQPLSPSGSIPGLNDGTDVPPPPLDIDAFLNTSGDYFNDFPTDGTTNDFDFAGGNNRYNFSDPPGDDDELFGNVDGSGQQNDLDQFKSSQTEEDGGGRVESVASSEVTTPPNTADTESIATRTRGRKASLDGGRSPAKRRKRNA